MSQQSDAVRTAKQTAIETTIGTAPILKLFATAKPTNCAAADNGTAICSITLPADWATEATGVLTKSGTWSGTASAAGLARHWRLYNSAGTTCHWQGLVSEPWAASKAYLLNQQVHNGGNVYVCTTAGTSAASGGPTGTGTGITDGTAVWSYVGPLDMALDNTSLNASQAVSVSTFTNTDANG